MLKPVKFFVAPDGRILSVSRNHIDEVIAAPEQFGLTRSAVVAAYHRHQEPLGLEGKAREELLAHILKEGWIRVRTDPRSELLVLQMARPLAELDRVLDFIIQAKARLALGPQAGLRLLDLQGQATELGLLSGLT